MAAISDRPSKSGKQEMGNTPTNNRQIKGELR
jgi:hypothetical protein